MLLLWLSVSHSFYHRLDVIVFQNISATNGIYNPNKWENNKNLTGVNHAKCQTPSKKCVSHVILCTEPSIQGREREKNSNLYKLGNPAGNYVGTKGPPSSQLTLGGGWGGCERERGKFNRWQASEKHSEILCTALLLYKMHYKQDIAGPTLDIHITSPGIILYCEYKMNTSIYNIRLKPYSLREQYLVFKMLSILKYTNISSMHV